MVIKLINTKWQNSSHQGFKFTCTCAANAILRNGQNENVQAFKYMKIAKYATWWSLSKLKV